jgi:hypothetical protein
MARINCGASTFLAGAGAGVRRVYLQAGAVINRTNNEY